MNYPQKSINWLLDLVFPIRCVSCREFGRYLCKECANSIPLKKRFECIGCKGNTSFGETCSVCLRSCHVGQLFIVASYDEYVVKGLVKVFKYRFIREAIDPLFGLMARYLKWLGKERGFNIFQSNPVIVPVPLYGRRLNWRGFNQAQLLADRIGGTYQMNIADCLLKKTETRPQAEIEERGVRLSGVKGVFNFRDGFRDSLEGREVLLVDDICTTGATLNECAKILKENGVKRVVALVIARG